MAPSNLRGHNLNKLASKLPENAFSFMAKHLEMIFEMKNFFNYLPFEEGMAFYLNKLELPRGSGEEDEIVKYFRQQQQYNERQQTNCNQKSSYEPSDQGS